jgi:hypothetical protein
MTPSTFIGKTGLIGQGLHTEVPLIHVRLALRGADQLSVRAILVGERLSRLTFWFPTVGGDQGFQPICSRTAAEEPAGGRLSLHDLKQGQNRCLGHMAANYRDFARLEVTIRISELLI